MDKKGKKKALVFVSVLVLMVVGEEGMLMVVGEEHEKRESWLNFGCVCFWGRREGG